MKRFCLLSIAAAAHGFVVQPLAPVRMAPALGAALGAAPIAAPLPLALRTAVPQQPRVHSAPAMGLFMSLRSLSASHAAVGARPLEGRT